MKEKLLLVSCAAAVLVSAAALAAVLSARASAAAPAAPPPAARADFGLKIFSEDKETRVYAFRSEGHTCFIASARGGSGLSLSCPAQ